MSKSKKNDNNKLRWDLLPLETIEEAVKVYTFGSIKYDDNTWQDLPDGQNRYYAALLRHLVEWKKGNKTDEESKLNHLSHVLWNAIALCYYEGKDDEIL